MAVYFDAGRGRSILLDEDLTLQLIGDGEVSEIEGYSSNEDDGQPPPPDPLPSTSGHTSGTTTQKKKNKKTQQKKKQKDKRRTRVWKVEPFIGKEHHYSALPAPKEVRTPLQDLSDYFNEDFYINAANCTNLYHFRQKGVNLNCTPVEIKKFIGIHLFMGCIPYPRLHMYWLTNMQLQMITSVMSRDRFLALRAAFHVVERDDPPSGNNNPLWKIQPIIDAVKDACLKLERTPGFYSIDEQMIPFKGRCGLGLRQVVKNKPRPVGLKNFVLTTSEGLMLDFEIYRGKNTGFGDRELGLGPSVILHLAKTIPPNSCVYFNRYFTTIPLLERLEKDGIHGTGTILFNRVAERKNLNIKKDRDMERGEIQENVSGDSVFIKWMDKKGIYLASNCTGAGVASTVPRWDKVNRQFIEVNAPQIVKNYNSYVGGVDVLDQLMEYYRTYIKTRKWTLKVMVHFIDLALVNSWRLYKNDCVAHTLSRKQTMDLLAFRLALAEAMVSTPTKRRQDLTEEDLEEEVLSSKRHRPAIAPTNDKRYDGYDHLPKFDEISSPRCCRYERCCSRTKIMCSKCKVYLCILRGKNCFFEYHVKKK